MIRMIAIFNFSRFSRACRIKNSFMPPEMFNASVSSYLGNPLVCFSAKMDSCYSRFVIFLFPLVLTVFSMANFPEIFNSIIKRISVYVVNLFCWMRTIIIKPRQSMGAISNVVYFYVNIFFIMACHAYCPCNGRGVSRVEDEKSLFRVKMRRWPFFPGELACFHAVIKAFFKVVPRYFHDIMPTVNLTYNTKMIASWSNEVKV